MVLYSYSPMTLDNVDSVGSNPAILQHFGMLVLAAAASLRWQE
jgi:hypothetical protein